MNVEPGRGIDAVALRPHGPKSGDEPQVPGTRHPVLASSDETDILPFGGTLEPLTVDPKAQVLLTYIPTFPDFLPADIDRRLATKNLPDHGDLLANLMRWASGGSLPLELNAARLSIVNWTANRADS
jgi:hypothetical protein